VQVAHWQVLPPGSQVAPVAQSPSPAQGAALHAVAAQAYGAQLVVVPGLQVPAPSQLDAAVSIDVAAAHEAGAHGVPMASSSHDPAPSQVPSVPHVARAIARQLASGSVPPLGTGWQLPALPETAQDEHAEQLAAPQQTCSTQWPLMHVVPSVHAPPFGVRFVHDPLAHELPVAQSPSPAHVVRQLAPAPHMYAPQLTGVCLHVPAPLQKPCGISVDVVQEAVPHDVIAGAFSHAPAPSQVPTKPHGGLAAQRACGSAASAGTALQVPSRPATLHASHVPHDIAAQHTPSTHALSVRQSASEPHAPPSRCLSPHWFVLRSQIAGDAQSASETQVVLHAAPLHT
jgi:hypothetical protein